MPGEIDGKLELRMDLGDSGPPLSLVSWNCCTPLPWAFSAVFALSCAWPAINYFHLLLFHTLTPFVLVGLVALATYIYHLRLPHIKPGAVRRRTLKATFLVTNLVYLGVSNKVRALSSSKHL